MSNAEILGSDPRTCPCCGGLEISIDNVQNPNGGLVFLVGDIPSDFKIPDNQKFPMAVKLDWKIDTALCFGNYIDIIRIARR